MSEYNGTSENDIIKYRCRQQHAYGHAGDDTINVTDKSGAFIDTLSGGSGSYTLNINYQGINDLSDFTI
jgi:hypothetical protein